jgi:hypothetical protein
MVDESFPNKQDKTMWTYVALVGALFFMFLIGYGSADSSTPILRVIVVNSPPLDVRRSMPLE